MNRRNFLVLAAAGIVNACTPSILKKRKPIETTSDEQNYNPSELFSLLEKNGLKPARTPIISNNPNAKTIILIEDEDHRKSTVKILNKLEKIKQITKKNLLVGLEGWCGKEIDKKRGKRVLIANNNLIKILVDDYSNQFEIIGLENEDLQLEFVNMVIAIYYFKFTIDKTDIKTSQNMLEYHLKVFYDASTNEKMQEIAKKQFKKYKNQINKSNPFKMLFGDIAIRRDYYSTKKSIAKTKDIGIIIYGSSHTQNITQHLKNELNNNFNLYII